MSLKADAPTRLSSALSWGSHRLTVIDRAEQHDQQTHFYVGWYGGSDNGEEAPDTLRVASDKENYAPGETARCASRRRSPARRWSPSPPTASSAPAACTVPAGGTTIDVPVKAEWGAGAYALVTAWRPLGARRAHADARHRRSPGSASIPSCARSPSRSARRRRSRRASASRCRSRSATSGARKRSSRWPRSTKASCSSRASRRPIRPTTISASAGSASRHARRLWPPAGHPRRRSRPHPRRRRCRRHRRPRHRADPHRGAVQRSGEARRQGRGQDRARHPRLHRPAPADGGGLRQDRVGSGEAAPVRARRRHRRRRAAALPRAQGSRAGGAVAAQCRRPGRRLSRDPGGHRRGLAGAAGRRDPTARRQPARAADLAAAPADAGFGKVAVAVSGPGNFAVRREWDIQVRPAQTPSAVDTVARLAAGRELTVDRNVTAASRRAPRRSACR